MEEKPRICGRSVKSWSKDELREMARILMVRGRSHLDALPKEQLFQKLKEAEAKRPISRAQEKAIQNIKRRDGRVEAAMGDTGHAKVRSSSSQTGSGHFLKPTFASAQRSKTATTENFQQQRAGEQRRWIHEIEPTTNPNACESRSEGLSSRNGRRGRHPPSSTAKPSPQLEDEDFSGGSAAPVSATALERQKQESPLEPENSELRTQILRARNPYGRLAASLQLFVPLANHHDAALAVSADSLQRECIVCSEQITVTEDEHSNTTATCTHARDVCAKCLQRTFQSQFETRGWENFTCPSCCEPFQYNDMKLWAPADLFERYDSYLASKAMESDDSIISCGLRGCTGRGLCDPIVDSWVTCNICLMQICLGCRAEYHAGKTCQESREEKDEDLQTARRNHEKEQEEQATIEHLQNQIYGGCPNAGCGALIEKIEGCDHMTCFRCRHEFCWQCFVPQNEIRRVGNNAHHESCSHHRP